MGIATVPQFLDTLRDSQLLGPAEWKQLAVLQQQTADLRALARELVKRGWLTAYQVNQLVRGKGKELTLGPYHLLELLGEGGMGQVFKARHPIMKRIVALKVVRADKLGSGELLRRFQREIEAAGKLSHPNVVIAHDAGQSGNTLYFVMEFIEGTDLGKLVRDRGPLPVGEACDYMRQAALGLQHAHEHGLVHRDIKPGNLLLARGGVIKILDMGLARLHAADQPGDSLSALTQDGMMMGTPDYLAPEQATDAHKVDIRADIYSLGCTLYALLAGQAPFAGGSLAQKIAAHLHSEPPPIENLRPGLPPALSAVIRRMLAKHPDHRYRTPAEVAVALAPFCVPVHVAGGTTVPASALAGLPPVPSHMAPLGPVPAPGEASTFAGGHTEPVRAAARPSRRWLVPVGVIGSVLLVVLVLVVSGAFRGSGTDGQGKGKPGEQNGWENLPKVGPLTLDRDAPNLAVRKFTGHQQQVTGVALARDDKFAVTGSTDGSLRFWDAKTGELRASREHLKGLWSVALSADGKHVLSGEGGWWEGDLYRNALRYDIRLWEVGFPNPREVRRFEGHTGEILALAFLPDGKRFLSSSMTEGLWLWSVDEEKPLRRLTDAAAFGSLALSGDGRQVLLCEFGGGLMLWDVERWEPVRKFKGKVEQVRSIALSADGRRALSSSWDRVLRVWDATTGEEMGQLPQPETIVTGLALSPDGRWGATGGGTVQGAFGQGARTADRDHVVRLFDLQTRTEVRHYDEHTSAILALTFSADGRHLLSGACDATARLFRWAR
ncbi:MAG: serine/threonine protein kinase [Gemmataceae bacterium]|nr:serine/threonine protein kinase [Gemmataceae bacterium]